jgi:hypothetical protein
MRCVGAGPAPDPSLQRRPTGPPLAFRQGGSRVNDPPPRQPALVQEVLEWCNLAAVLARLLGDNPAMKLVRLELESFRAFDHATVDFPESGVLLVAGANNSGKSALLSALDSLARNESFGEMRHYGSSTPARISARFRLSEQERDGLLQNVTDRTLLESIAFREVSWEFREVGQSGLRRFALRRIGRCVLESYPSWSWLRRAIATLSV